MSLFGDLDVASAHDNPFFKPDGTYTCLVTKCEVKYSKNNNKGMALEYTIQEGDKEGKKFGEWKNIPEPWEVMGYASKEDFEAAVNFDDKIKERANRDLSFLKLRLKQFGFTPEEMGTIGAEEILSLPWLAIELKNYSGRENIADVKILADSMTAEGNSFS